MSGSGGVKDVMVVCCFCLYVRALETDELYPLGFKFFDWDDIMGL